MSLSHYQVAVRFAERASKRNARGNNVYTAEDNTAIYSFGHHFAMAYAEDDRKAIIINGDTYSSFTSRHQSDLRGALAANLPKDYTQIIVPFSIAQIDRADFDIHSVEEIEVEVDHNLAVCYTHDMKWTESDAWRKLQNHISLYTPTSVSCKTHYEHRLGGSVFRAKSGRYGEKPHTWKYFLSGFDETANGNNGYFVSLLPRKVSSVDEAYEVLKPKAVKEAIAAGIEVKRQGDVFAIPAPEFKSRRAFYREDAHKRKRINWPYGVFIEYPMLNESHAANHVVMDKRKRVYAKGSLIHRPRFRRPEHRRIPLGNVWHRIFFNTALGSWSAQGRVD